MNFLMIIEKKKRGRELSRQEIEYAVHNFTEGRVPDYQMAAFLMAVCLKGMTSGETSELTMAMARSGDMVDLSRLPGVKVDKHSTGGVGDKTTLIAAPVAAAWGVLVPKMSGPGLGHTGGTIDKLHSIPGLRTEFDQDGFIHVLEKAGLCVAGQSGNLAPADKKIYNLRSATATTDSLPLIAASIMSKKLAAGSDKIVLDVKLGSGAFMKTIGEALALAEAMVRIGHENGRETTALLTEMDAPLGRAIGNALEIREVSAVLKGGGPSDLTEVSLALAAEMLALGGKGPVEKCVAMAREAIKNGKALDKLAEMVRAQGGDSRYVYYPDLFENAAFIYEIKSPAEGFIRQMDAESCGRASMILGAGRETKESAVDYSAGILLNHKKGDYIKKGETLAYFHCGAREKINEARDVFLEGVCFSENKPEPALLIRARADRNGVEEFIL